MDSRRTRRLLIIAFALSLLVHVIVASGLRPPFSGVTRDRAEIIHVVRMTHVTRIARAQTPPPHTPPPRTPPPQTPAPSPQPARVPHKVPRLSHSATGTVPNPGGIPGKARPAVTPPPATAPIVAASSCANSDSPAALAASPQPPDLSPQARADAKSATARIRVTLDADGHVQGTAVIDTTGSGSLDLAAVSMARSAQYTPAQHNCKAVASNYLFSVKFVSW